MKRLVEFPLDEGTRFLAEVEEPESEAGLAGAGHAEEVVERASRTFIQVLGWVRPVGSSLGAFQDIVIAPSPCMEEAS